MRSTSQIIYPTLHNGHRRDAERAQNRDQPRLGGLAPPRPGRVPGARRPCGPAPGLPRCVDAVCKVITGPARRARCADQPLTPVAGGPLRAKSAKKEMMMWEALREGLDEEMERDPKVCLIGALGGSELGGIKRVGCVTRGGGGVVCARVDQWGMRRGAIPSCPSHHPLLLPHPLSLKKR